jgi:hypothetical protein
MFVRSSIRSNAVAAKLRRLSQAKKCYVTAARSPCRFTNEHQRPRWSAWMVPARRAKASEVFPFSLPLP